jgi:hypothetical protein
VTCYGEPHQIEVLVGDAGSQASISGFALYLSGTQQDTKRWRVSLAYVDTKHSRVYFSAISRDSSALNVSLAVDGANGLLRVGSSTQDVSCDWNGINE